MAINRARNEFLVAWERYDGGAALTDIYGRLMTGTGQPLQPTSIEYARMTVSNTKPAVVALPTASSIGHYLVIWELRYAAGDRDIYGRTAASSSLRRTNRSWPSRAFTANFWGDRNYMPAILKP